MTKGIAARNTNGGLLAARLRGLVEPFPLFHGRANDGVILNFPTLLSANVYPRLRMLQTGLGRPGEFRCRQHKGWLAGRTVGHRPTVSADD